MLPSLMAAHLGIPMKAPSAPVAPSAPDVASPAPKKKKGKGLAHHFQQFKAAHKAGDFGQAKTHALNYANAASKMAGGGGGMPTDPENC